MSYIAYLDFVPCICTSGSLFQDLEEIKNPPSTKCAGGGVHQIQTLVLRILERTNLTWCSVILHSKYKYKYKYIKIEIHKNTNTNTNTKPPINQMCRRWCDLAL